MRDRRAARSDSAAAVPRVPRQRLRRAGGCRRPCPAASPAWRCSARSLAAVLVGLAARPAAARRAAPSCRRSTRGSRRASCRCRSRSGSTRCGGDDPGRHRHRLPIHVYSTAYMHEETDGEYARYFSYLNLFAAFMLVLVLGANFLVMFVGLGGRRPLLVPAHRLLVHASSRPSTRARRPSSSTASATSASSLGMLAASGASSGRSTSSEVARLAGAAAARGDLRRRLAGRRCCSSSARPASRRRSRSTSGCPTPWKARRRSPPSSTPRRW